jgi:hypothetical protein
METNFYLPLLKSKAGEFKALATLNPKLKSKIVPLFDVTRMEYDHEEDKKPKTIEEHLQKFCKKVIQNWPNNPMFLDSTLVNSEKADGLPAIVYIFQELAKKQIFPMPVVYTNSTYEFVMSIQKILYSYDVQEIGIRVTIEDITSSNFEKNLEDILSLLEIPFSQCHVIFDLKDSDFTHIEDFAEGILEVLSEFPHLKDWKSFTIAGGAFPPMGKIKSTSELIPRNDWILFQTLVKKLKKTSINRPINFGDYSIVSAGYFEFNPKIMSTSANIRYTHNECWFVVKGRALKKGPDWQQFYGQAETIVKSSYYLGETFSAGDLHIKKCANRLTTTGNANKWIEVGTNHHFTKVIGDLFAKSA